MLLQIHCLFKVLMVNLFISFLHVIKKEGRKEGWMDGWMDGIMERWKDSTNIPVFRYSSIQSFLFLTKHIYRNNKIVILHFIN